MLTGVDFPEHTNLHGQVWFSPIFRYVPQEGRAILSLNAAGTIDQTRQTGSPLPTAACDDSPDRTLPTKPVTVRTPGKLARPRVPFSRPPSRPRAFVRQPPRGPTPASKHAPRLLPSPPGTKVATATAAPKYRTPKAPLPHLLEPSSHGPAPLHACRLRSRRPWPRRGRLVLPSPPPRPLSRRRRPCRRFLGRLAGERRAATADESAAAGAAAAARDAILPRVGARPPPRQGEPPQLWRHLPAGEETRILGSLFVSDCLIPALVLRSTPVAKSCKLFVASSQLCLCFFFGWCVCVCVFKSHFVLSVA